MILSVWLLKINLGIALHSFFPSHIYQQKILLAVPSKYSPSHHLVQITMTSGLLHIVPFTLIFDLLPTKNLFLSTWTNKLLLAFVYFWHSFLFWTWPPYSDLGYPSASLRSNHSFGPRYLLPVLHQIQQGAGTDGKERKKTKAINDPPCNSVSGHANDLSDSNCECYHAVIYPFVLRGIPRPSPVVLCVARPWHLQTAVPGSLTTGF